MPRAPAASTTRHQGGDPASIRAGQTNTVAGAFAAASTGSALVTTDGSPSSNVIHAERSGNGTPDAWDSNKDGKLQRGELPRHHGHKGRRGPGGEGHGARFASLDKDGDRRVSKAEAAAEPGFAERFARLDANSDGFVDRADRELAARQRKDAWFKAADSNQDGSLSKAEFDAAHARRADESGKRRSDPAS